MNAVTSPPRKRSAVLVRFTPLSTAKMASVSSASAPDASLVRRRIACSTSTEPMPIRTSGQNISQKRTRTIPSVFSSSQPPMIMTMTPLMPPPIRRDCAKISAPMATITAGHHRSA